MEYHYPIDPDWSTEEVINVVEFFQLVEQAYEKDVRADQVLEQYKLLKQVVPSKAEEKTIFKDFEKQSGYVPYKAVQAAKQAEKGEKVSL